MVARELSRAGTATPQRRTLLRPAAVLVLLGALLAFAPALRGAEQPSFQEVEESLTCQCGCGLTVHSCNHLQCPSALPLRAEIREQLAAGADKATILAYFRDKYGEKILSAPTTSGFNLVAWVTPFIVVLIGGVIIAMIARRWRAEGPQPEPPTTPAPSKDSPYREILERELRDLDP